MADLNNQGGIGIKSIIRRDYNVCGYGVDHLVTDQSCAIHKLISQQWGGYASDHPAVILTVTR